jgi:hypothetical protein
MSILANIYLIGFLILAIMVLSICSPKGRQ